MHRPFQVPFAVLLTHIRQSLRTKEKIMEWKLFATVFGAIFVAEMADKTQLVTLLFAADKAAGKWTVFFASALALTTASAIGVVAGTLLSQVISARMMSMIAGTGFIVIGLFTLWHGWQGGNWHSHWTWTGKRTTTITIVTQDRITTALLPWAWR